MIFRVAILAVAVALGGDRPAFAQGDENWRVLATLDWPDPTASSHPIDMWRLYQAGGTELYC
ncbi:MAG: hypothetical protein ABL889_05650, partial [Terricaulis sp.]